MSSSSSFLVGVASRKLRPLPIRRVTKVAWRSIKTRVKRPEANRERPFARANSPRRPGLKPSNELLRNCPKVRPRTKRKIEKGAFFEV
jgi:hypothetical protein